MNKNYLLWFALLAIIMLGCRSESINSEETNTISQQKFHVVSKSSIPSIINELQSRTNNFRISLKTNSIEGKTETAFGEIDTNYIISTEKDGETYYIFPIISQKSDSETTTYNLELKASAGTIEESKVLAYEPTDEWVLNGNDDYTSFSGTISTYNIAGDLENSSTFVSGKSGCTPPEPCPDCPVNPNGPGGTDGGGTPGGGWTGTGSGGGGGTTGGDGGGTSGGGGTGGVWLLHCETINKELKCWMVFYSQRVSVTACGGSAGGVITAYVPSSYINTILTQYHSSLALSESEKNFLNSHKDIANNLADFLRKNNTQQNAAFVKWAAWFFTANSDTTWPQFESWFITKSEGSDGEYINNLDDILTSIQYQTRQMPTYSQFVTAFPKLNYPGYPGYFTQMPASQVYPMVGGSLENLYNTTGKDSGPYRNACTVRFSLAMNRIGVYIPNNTLSRQGANVNGQERYYYLQAKTAGDFMQKTFGNPTYKLEGADVNDPNKVANFLKGKTGIYVIVNNNSNTAGYTGHVDLIQNGHVPGGANAYNVPGGIKSIRIWTFTP